jgi:phospholipid/cholesterol/gamma-HCH transport system substrate-binding protein
MRRKYKALPYVLVFVLVTSLLTGIVAVTLGRIKIQDSTTYSADFSDISGLQEGSDVRAAGVTVGTVEDMKLDIGTGTVRVSFSVPRDLPLTTTTEARIRYANLTGDRYLDLTKGVGVGTGLKDYAVIPVTMTVPALDLDLLFNGFKPLMQALSPKDVNALTASLIQVTQGESGSIQKLLGSIGSFTNGLADRDALIGSVVDNLNVVLTTVDDRRDNVDRIIVGLAGLLDGLAKDRRTIGASLSDINTFTAETRGLVEEFRPEFREVVTQIRRVSRAVNSNSAYVTQNLDKYPKLIAKLGRGGAYGSFFNFYLCGIRFKIGNTGGTATYSPFLMSKESRCRF